jgi:transcription initiation factor TFIID subunit 5
MDVYRPELVRLLWPIFVHCLLDLAAGYFMDPCSKFLDAFSARFKNEHGDDLRKLSVIRMPEHLHTSDIAKIYRNNKYRLTMSKMAHSTILQFLEANENEGGSLLTQMLQSHLNIIPVDRAQLGSERSLAAMLARGGEDFEMPAEDEGIPGHNPGSANQALNAPTALPRVLLGALQKDQDLMDDVRAELQDEDTRHPPELGQSTLVNELEATIKREPVEDGPTREMVPLPPPLARDVALEVQKIRELRDRFKIDPRTGGVGPGISVCMYTFHNTKDSINCIDFSGDLQLVAAGTAQNHIRVWSLDGSPLPASIRPSESNAKPVSSRRLVGHSGPIYAVAFSPAATKNPDAPDWFPSTHPHYLLSSSADKTIRLWNVDTWSCLVVYKGHNAPVWDVKWSPHGHYFATGGWDRCARLWATEHISPLRMFAGHDSDVEIVAWHPNGAYVFTAGSDRTVRMWDINTGRAVRMFTGHTGNPTAIECAPNGKVLASADDQGSIILWDLEKGGRIKRMRGHGKGGIWSLSWSVESTVLVSGGADNTVRVWDVEQKHNPDGSKAGADGAQVSASTGATAAGATGAAAAVASVVSAAHTQKKKAKDAVTTPDQISAFPTKQSPVYKVLFSKTNCVLAGSAFLPENA